MKNFLTIHSTSSGLVRFTNPQPASIGISPLSPSLRILKIFWDELNLEPESEYADPDTMLTLSNFPTQARSLPELDGTILSIPNGFYHREDIFQTQLAIWDGDHINDNQLSFEWDGTFFQIHWKGITEGYQGPKYDFEARFPARPVSAAFQTHICVSDEVLLACFDK